MPKISVVIPVYNAEEYIEKCLNSVVNQTLSDIEILCVNDGSADNSLYILQSYAQKYANIKIFDQENSGQSVARNTALAAAQGEFVFFLDSDDCVDLDAFEVLYARATKDNLDVLFYNAKSFFENDGVMERNRQYISFYDRNSEYPGVYTGQELFALMRKNRDYYGSACLQMIRRSLLEENHIRYYPGIIHEDNLFVFQCVILAERAGYQDTALYHRLVHDNSTMTQKKTIRNVEGYLVCYHEMLSFLNTVELEESVVPVVKEYLYYSMFRNAVNIFRNLDAAERARGLSHGGNSTEQILYLLDRTLAIELDRDKQKRRAEELDRKLGKHRDTWLIRKIKGGIQCLKDNGLKYTINRIGFKIGNRLKALNRKYVKNPVYAKLTWLPRKMCHWAGIVRKNGWKGACRIIKIKQKMRSGGAAPLVSFILPVYNVEDYLEQGLNTLVNQTMKHIEIICVDDGSTDRSLEILQSYANKDKRFRIFTQENKFAGAARNLGLANARGEYVVFLDSDDFFHKALAEKAYLQAKIHDADVVLYGAKRYHHTTGKYEEMPWLLRINQLPQKSVFSHVDFPDTFYQTMTAAPWTKLYRRQFLLDTGLQYQTIRNSNDFYFSFCATAMTGRIAVLDEKLVYYRVGHGNSLQAGKTKHPLCFCEAILGVYHTLHEKGLWNTLERSFINLALENSVWNLQSTLDWDAKHQIYQHLKTVMFPELKMEEYPANYFLKQEQYHDLCRILEMDFDSYMALFYDQGQKKLDEGKALTEMERQTLKLFHQERMKKYLCERADNLILSVIVPVYNVESYLRECLDSLLVQPMERMEVICVDDGSTDDSGAILDAYARKDPRVKVIHKQKNEGLLLGRKTGVEQARGRYTLFIDSDDYVGQDLLTFVEKTIFAEYADIIQYRIGVDDYSGDEKKAEWLTRALNPDPMERSGGKILEDAFVTRAYTTALLGKVYKTDLCKMAYSRLPDVRCTAGEDIFTYFYLAYFARTYQGIQTPELYFYRHGTGITNVEMMPLEKFEVYCQMVNCVKWIWEDLVKGSADTALVSSWEAMARRMSQDCCRIYKNRIQQEDKQAAFRILSSYWSDVSPARQIAQKELNCSL